MDQGQYRAANAAAYLDVSVDQLRKLPIPHHKIGKFVYYAKADLDGFVAGVSSRAARDRAAVEDELRRKIGAK